MKLLTRFWDFVDTRGVIRRLVLGVSVYMLWVTGEHSFVYAMISLDAGKADAGIAAVIAAFGVPASTLAGYVFKAYLDSRP